MEITEVRVSLREGGNRKLKAYATITFDNAFVVRNIKVIEGNKGLFVAMPSRKMRESCPKCNYKNATRSKFCNQCGAGLPQTERKPHVEGERAQQSEHRDIAHPITLECREYIQKKVLSAYESEHKEPSPEKQAAAKPAPAKPAVVKPAVAKPVPKVVKNVAPKETTATIHDDELESGDIEL